MEQANLLDLIEILSKQNSFFMSKYFFKKWKTLIENIEPIDTTFKLNNIFDKYFETAFYFDKYGELPIVFYSDNILKLIQSQCIKSILIKLNLYSNDIHYDIPDDYSRKIDYGEDSLIVCLMPRYNKLTFTVIDGNHRATKASDSGNGEVNAYFISPDALTIDCFVNTQSYINYKFLIECFILSIRIKDPKQRIHRFFNITLKRLLSKSI